MKCLLSGGSGFLGSALLKALLADDRISRVVVVSRRGLSGVDSSGKMVGWRADLTSAEQVQDVVRYAQPDVIFHFAGHATVQADSQAEVVKTNVLGTQHLLEYAPSCRFVLASTVVVYGNQGLNGLCCENTIPNPNSIYGASKLGSEALVNAYTQLGRVNGISLRYCAVVGKGATHGAVKDFVRKAKSDSPELEVFGDYPGPCKPYLHVDDAVSAALYFGLSRPEVKGAIDVVPSNTIFMDTVAKTVMKGLGVDKPIKWMGQQSTWPGDNPKIYVSGTKAKIFGWEPRHKTSEEAILDVAREV